MVAVAVIEEFTVTVVVATEEQVPVVTVTLYTPLIAVVAPVIVGFCKVEEKEFGPLHEKFVPPVAESEIVCPGQ